MKIKVITIDLWNTLFDSSNGTKRNAYRQHALLNEIEKMNIQLPPDDYNNALKASWEFFNNIWLNNQRTPDTIEMIEFFWSYLKLPYNRESIENVAYHFQISVFEHPPKLIGGVQESLEILSQKYKLGLISDTGFTPGSLLIKLMQNFGIFDYFSAFSFSDETGVSKPNKKAYLTILNKFAVNPEEAVHIGDIEKTDIKGAKELGMNAIRFSGDPTAVMNKDNSKTTMADFEVSHWNDVVKCIEILNNQE